MKWRSNVNYSEGDRKINLFTMISMHVQLLLGLALFTMSGRVDFSQMKDAMFRFFSVEHTTMMVIAIALVTIGHAKSKKAADDAKKHKTIFIYYLIALLLVLVAIPWPFRGWGNGWF
jgi:cell division protein FtsW (lipid II flippase)